MSKSLRRGCCRFNRPKNCFRFWKIFRWSGARRLRTTIIFSTRLWLPRNQLRPIDWLYTKSVGDLTWEIKREQAIKVGIIELIRKEIVLDLLKTTRNSPNALNSPHIGSLVLSEQQAYGRHRILPQEKNLTQPLPREVICLPKCWRGHMSKANLKSMLLVSGSNPTKHAGWPPCAKSSVGTKSSRSV